MGVKTKIKRKQQFFEVEHFGFLEIETKRYYGL